MKIIPLDKIAAEVVDFNITQDMSREMADSLYSALLEHQVLVFRNQPLTRDQHLEFTEWFGVINTYPHMFPILRTKTHTNIKIIINKPVETGEVVDLVTTEGCIGECCSEEWPRLFYQREFCWGSDLSWKIPHEQKIGIFRAVNVPEEGGNTHFCSQYDLYGESTIDDKDFLEKNDGLETVDYIINSSGDVVSGNAYSYPLIQTHPETGKKMLKWSSGLRAFTQATPDEFKVFTILAIMRAGLNVGYIHKWSNNDVVMFDNRCIIKKTDMFDPKYPRQLEYTSVF